MLSTEQNHKNIVEEDINRVASMDLLPRAHVNFLYKMRDEFGFNPKVIYDCGACVGHWLYHARAVWPDAKIYIIDAFEPLEKLYKEMNYDYQIAILADSDKYVKFFCNDLWYGGCSVYRENNDKVFPKDNFVVRRSTTLDKLAKNNNWKQPDLIKMDLQGAELDAIIGTKDILKNCKYLILELQKIQYNIGAPLADTVIEYLASIGWELIAPEFSKNDADADYLFRNNNLKE